MSAMASNLPKPNYKTAELMTHSTARITCTYESHKGGTGTGFFYRFSGEDYAYPVLITNKHVLKNQEGGAAVEGEFILSRIGENGNRLHISHVPIGFHGYADGWIPHPVDGIDLCVLPLAPWLEVMEERAIKPFIVYNDISSLPTKEQYNSFSPMEKITMVGYPDGIWDQVNNLPIVRYGYTATAANIDYNGQEVFLIDAAVYPGSSGSPVYLYDESVKLTKKSEAENVISQKTRIHLLGVASAVKTQSWDGTIEVRDIPISKMPVPVTDIPINLGIVIKSTRISEFEPLLRKMDTEITAKSVSSHGSQSAS
ncbi:MAG: S1 family peptidase [Nitrososphaera sp.]